MIRTPDPDAVELLLETVAAEGSAVLAFPGQDLMPPGNFPAAWVELLAGRESPAAFVARTWSPLRDHLPRTLELLPAKLSTIALLQTDSRPPSLIYLFGLTKDLFANRGFAPVQADADSPHAGRLPVDIAPLRKVHDGWVDYFSLDGGVLPATDWKVLGEESAPFLEIFRNGADALGIDLQDPGQGFLLLEPDDESVRRVADFWAWLDDFLASSLEDLDDSDAM